VGLDERRPLTSFQHHLSPAMAIVPIAVPALPLTLNGTVALYSESDTFSTGPSLALAADDTPSITWSMSRPASAHLSALSVARSFALMPSTIACATFSGPPEQAVLPLLKKNPGATKPVTPTAMSTTSRRQCRSRGRSCPSQAVRAARRNLRVFLAVLVCLPVLLLLVVARVLLTRVPLTLTRILLTRILPTRIPRAALLRETTRRGLSTLAVRLGLLAVGLSWLGWICH
jgi:hypothetical protein